MLRILPSPQIAKHFACQLRQLKRFVEFVIGDQSRIASDGSTVELQLDLAVKTTRNASLRASPIGCSCLAGVEVQKTLVLRG